MARCTHSRPYIYLVCLLSSFKILLLVLNLLVVEKAVEEAARHVTHRAALRGSIVAHAITQELKTLFACRVLELHQMDIIHMVLSTVRAVQIQHNLVIGLAILAILSAPPLHLGFALLVAL